MERGILKQFMAAFLAAGFSCLLFGSGLLAVLTPFPIFFVSTVYGRKAGRLSALLLLVLGAAAYLIALPLLGGMAGSMAAQRAVSLVPGAGLAGIFTLRTAGYFGFLYFLYFILFGVLFSEGMHRKWLFAKWVSVSCGAASLLLLAGAIAPEFFGVDVFAGIREFLHRVLGEVVAAQEAAGIANENIALIKGQMGAIAGFSYSILPSTVLLYGLAVSVANQLMARWLIRVPGVFSHFGEMSSFRLAEKLVWLPIAFGFLYFADMHFVRSPALRFLAVNGLIVSFGIYLFQGFVIALFYINRAGSRWFRAVIYIMMVTFAQFALPILAIGGFTDIWLDYRRLTKKPEKNRRRLPWK